MSEWLDYQLCRLLKVVGVQTPLLAPSHQKRFFALCTTCHRVFPLWRAMMTAAEAKRLGRFGCRCGGVRLQPAIIPGWQAAWWLLVRGWLIRHVLYRKTFWDPRMVVLTEDVKL